MVATFLLAFSAAGSLAQAQDLEAAIGKVPPQLKALKFGMSVAEAQKLLPEAGAFGSASGPRVLLFVTFKESREWDGAMLAFLAGKLDEITLLMANLKKEDNYLSRSQARAAEVIASNGANYTRLVTLNSSTQPVPAYVWQKDDFVLFVVGPSTGVSVAGKEIFPVDPQLAVGVAVKTRPIEDLMAVASAAQMVDFLFALLSPIQN